MDFGIGLPAAADSWTIVKRAEELGFSHAWFYDTQMLTADCFVAMAAAAVNTRRIRLGTGVLVSSNRIAPSAECKGDAYLGEYQLPRSLGEALQLLRDETDLHDVLGKDFVTVYTEVKEIEHAEFMKVISPWEREHLLLHV